MSKSNKATPRSKPKLGEWADLSREIAKCPDPHFGKDHEAVLMKTYVGTWLAVIRERPRAGRVEVWEMEEHFDQLDDALAFLSASESAAQRASMMKSLRKQIEADRAQGNER